MWEIKTLTPEQFALFERLIYRKTGIRMQPGKITLLSNRIRRRLRHHGLESFEEYYTLLTAGSLKGELEEFIDAITTNETYFFRESSQLNALINEVIPELKRRRRDRGGSGPVGIWSAGCLFSLFSFLVCWGGRQQGEINVQNVRAEQKQSHRVCAVRACVSDVRQDDCI